MTINTTHADEWELDEWARVNLNDVEYDEYQGLWILDKKKYIRNYLDGRINEQELNNIQT